MKTIYKISPIIILAVAILFTVPTMAISDNASSNGQNGSSSSTLCTRIANIQSAGNNNTDAKIATLQAQYSKQIAKMDSNQTQTQQQLLTLRNESSDAFEAKITALETQDNLTTAQLQAIETYATNMRTAEATRQASVDSAISQYKTDLESLISTNKQSMTSASNSFSAAVKNAFSTAVSNCGDETNVMSALRASIKEARQNFETNKQQSGSTISDDIQALRTTRNEAIKTTNQTFANLAKEYSQTLAEALSTISE